MLNRDKKLFINTIYLYIVTFIKIIFPLMTLPYLTRILSIDNFGLVAYVKAYNSYVQLILDYGFILSATKNVVHHKKDLTRLGRITGNVLAEKVILSVFTIVLTLFLSEYIDILNNNKLFVWLFLLSSLITILIPDFLFRGLEKMEYLTGPFVLSKVLVLLFTFVLIKDNSDILLIPILEILGNLVAAVVSIYFVHINKIKISFDGIQVWFNELKESSVYFFSNFSTTIFGALTTLIVGIYLEKKEVAYWSICMQIVTAAKTLYSPIVNSIYPQMIKELDWKLIRKIAKLFFIPIFLGVLLIIFFGDQIMLIIGGKSFHSAGYILKFLIPVFVVSFYSMLIGWPVLGARGFVKETTSTTIVAAVIQLLGIFALITFKRFDLITLAICCDLSEIYLLLSRMTLLRKIKS